MPSPAVSEQRVTAGSLSDALVALDIADEIARFRIILLWPSGVAELCLGHNPSRRFTEQPRQEHFFSTRRLAWLTVKVV